MGKRHHFLLINWKFIYHIIFQDDTYKIGENNLFFFKDFITSYIDNIRKRPVIVFSNDYIILKWKL